MASPDFGGSPRSRPFLTSEQRDALDAALAQKQGRLGGGIKPKIRQGEVVLLRYMDKCVCV